MLIVILKHQRSRRAPSRGYLRSTSSRLNSRDSGNGLKVVHLVANFTKHAPNIERRRIQLRQLGVVVPAKDFRSEGVRTYGLHFAVAPWKAANLQTRREKRLGDEMLSARLPAAFGERSRPTLSRHLC